VNLELAGLDALAPRGFCRIRHYGLLAARNVNTRLARAREVLTPEAPIRSAEPDTISDQPTPWWQRLLRLTGIDVMRCPYCDRGRLVRIPAGPLGRSPP